MRSTFLAATLLALGACGSAPSTTTSPPSPDLAQRAVDRLVTPAYADTVFDGTDRIADVAEHAVQAVVHIASEREVEAPQLPFRLPGMSEGLRQRGAGSGVLVDPDGLILTNNHVIDGADELTVTLNDGRKLPATVKGTDPATDLALLQLDGDVPPNLPAMAFGASEDLRLGEVVLAIGSPFELQGTVTMGIVSARGRSGFRLAAYEDYIQTDAAINPGNSGGALVDLDGKLVGINTAIRSQSGGYDGIGFAIPAHLAKDIMARLLADGRVVRGYLGVGIDDVSGSVAPKLGLPDARGALVTQVGPGTPADRAGLQAYDVITAIDGVPVADVNDLRNTIALKGAGTRVKVELVRDGKSKRLTAVLDELPQRGGTASAPAPEVLGGLLGGVVLGEADGAAAQRFDLAPDARGAVVVQVAPGSPAAQAGLRPGDVILEVDKQPVASADDVVAALEGADAALLRVQRGESRTLLVLE